MSKRIVLGYSHYSLRKSWPLFVFVIIAFILMIYVSVESDIKRQESFKSMSFSGRVNKIIDKETYYMYLVGKDWYVVRGSIIDVVVIDDFLLKQPNGNLIIIYKNDNKTTLEDEESLFEISK